MTYLIVSDAHADNSFLKFLDANSDKKIICLGDYCIDDAELEKRNVVFINGNCDKRKDKLFQIIDINNKKTLITHGHIYRVKYKLQNLYYKGLEEECDICLFGHTHQFHFERIGRMIMLNPGAYCDGEYVIMDDEKIEFLVKGKVYCSYKL